MRKKAIKECEQLSLFDIELPPNKPEVVREAVKINFAKVPDEEYTLPYKRDGIPTVDELLKLLERGLYKVSSHEFLSDIFECGAIAISNRFDMAQAADREARYLQIIKKYEPGMQRLITEIFAKIYLMLTQQINPWIGFNDYLGELYMRSETSNSRAGQFFTPYCVSKCYAEVTINPDVIADCIEKDRILTLNEPACGAGGMVLAAVDVLYNKYHFNYSRNLLVECSDIDSRCVHMSYLQLGLAGIPAVIYRRNTLTMETWERWETSAYIMQWMRFKNCLSGGYEWKPTKGEGKN